MKILYLTTVKQVQFTVFETIAEQYDYEIHLLGGKTSYRHNPNTTLYDNKNILLNSGRILAKLRLCDRGYFLRKQLPKIIESVRPDIIHAIGADFWGGLATSSSNLPPTIITCQGSDVFRYPFKNRKTFTQIQTALKKADLIHVLSKATVAHITKAFEVSPNKIIPIHWGIDTQTIDSILNNMNVATERGQWGLSDDDIVIFAPRGLRPVFRPITAFIKAILPLMQKQTNIKIIVMMHGKDNCLKKEIKSLFYQHNLESRVIYIEEFLTHKEVITLFGISDISASLAESDETSSAILEAMYCKTVPVLSNTLTYRSRFQDGKNVFFVDNQDIEKMRLSLENILANTNAIKSTIAPLNKSLISQKYNRQHNLQEIQALYARVTK